MDAVFVRFILFLFVRYTVINLLNLLYAVHKIPDNYYHPLFFCRLHKRKAAKEKPAVFFLLYRIPSLSRAASAELVGVCGLF